VSHLDISQLVDYWARELSPDQETAVEDHAFACDDCGRKLAAFGELADGVARVVARRGGIALMLTQSLVDELSRAGVVMREYHAKLGDIIPCGIGAREDLLVSHLEVDLSKIEHATLMFSSGGQVFQRLDDVPIDRAANKIIFALSGDMARTLPTMKIVAQLYDRDRLVGEAIFDHTAFSV
jgi:hypothetical protein